MRGCRVQRTMPRAIGQRILNLNKRIPREKLVGNLFFFHQGPGREGFLPHFSKVLGVLRYVHPLSGSLLIGESELRGDTRGDPIFRISSFPRSFEARR